MNYQTKKKGNTIWQIFLKRIIPIWLIRSTVLRGTQHFKGHVYVPTTRRPATYLHLPLLRLYSFTGYSVFPVHTRNASP